MRAILLVCLLAVFSAFTTASAQDRPDHLSCGSAEGLVNNVLNKLTAMTQLLNNSVAQTVSEKDLRKGFCGYKQFAPGSVGRFDGIFSDKSSKLAYVIYRVSLRTTDVFTGKLSDSSIATFAVDAVVSLNRWQVATDEDCGYFYRGACLVPRSCEVLNEFPASGNLLGFIDRRTLPFYVSSHDREGCRGQVIPDDRYQSHTPPQSGSARHEREESIREGQEEIRRQLRLLRELRE